MITFDTLIIGLAFHIYQFSNNQYTFAILIKDNLLCFIRTIKMITAFAFRILIYLLGFALAGY